MSPEILCFLLVLAGFVLVSTVSVVLSVRRRLAAQRAADVQHAAAARLGLSYSAEDRRNLPGRLCASATLYRGEFQEAWGVFSGTWRERKVAVFRYRWGEYGKNETLYPRESFSVALASSGLVSVPGLLVRPEGLVDRLASAAGFEDIDFESDEFSRAFLVRARDRKFAYSVITPQVMAHLLRNPGWCLELTGSDAVAYDGRLWEADEIPRPLDFLCDFLDLVPEFVWKDLASRKEAE